MATKRRRRTDVRNNLHRAARLKRRAPSADTLRSRVRITEQRLHSNLVARTMDERAAYLRARERAPWGLAL
jgi:hypothetical protein